MERIMSLKEAREILGSCDCSLVSGIFDEIVDVVLTNGTMLSLILYPPGESGWKGPGYGVSVTSMLNIVNELSEIRRKMLHGDSKANSTKPSKDFLVTKFGGTFKVSTNCSVVFDSGISSKVGYLACTEWIRVNGRFGYSRFFS